MIGNYFTEHLSWGRTIENTALSANRAANDEIAKDRVSGGFACAWGMHGLTGRLLIAVRK